MNEPAPATAHRGVATSTAGFLGYTPTGPVNRAAPVTSFTDFDRTFGGLAADSPVSYAVMDFFENGGQEAWVVRVVGSGTLDLPFPADFRGSEASGTGVWALEQATDLELLCVPEYEIVHPSVCKKFALALPELGLLPHTRRDKLHLTALPEKQRVSRVPMAYVEKLMRTKGAYAKDGES